MPALDGSLLNKQTVCILNHFSSPLVDPMEFYNPNISKEIINELKYFIIQTAGEYQP